MTGTILGIETSCDETSAAVIDAQGQALSLVIHSQDVHRLYGGVVPELAARAHLTQIDAVVGAALADAELDADQVDAVAVTAGPGLIGALLVGVGWAKGFALSRNIPLISVHHMEAHLFAPLLDHPDLEPPFLSLLVSGGHTQLIRCDDWGDYTLMGQTRDDAAGEAFDKVAKTLGLPYPGGPQIERLAREGNPKARRLPRPLIQGLADPTAAGAFEFSFSGLKTATALWVEELRREGTLHERRADVAASFQAAVVDTLVRKTVACAEWSGLSTVALGGGVSVNQSLRAAMSESLAVSVGSEARTLWASPRFSLDNGAMIGRAGMFRWAVGDTSSSILSADARLEFPGLSPRRT
jgi:N6-L-threonylcarbamoyladenine synthase